MWLIVGFVIAVPTFFYVAGIALLNRLLRKERPLAKVVMLSSRQKTQCQVSTSKDGQS